MRANVRPVKCHLLDMTMAAALTNSRSLWDLRKFKPTGSVTVSAGRAKWTPHVTTTTKRQEGEETCWGCQERGRGAGKEWNYSTYIVSMYEVVKEEIKDLKRYKI